MRLSLGVADHRDDPECSALIFGLINSSDDQGCDGQRLFVVMVSSTLPLLKQQAHQRRFDRD